MGRLVVTLMVIGVLFVVTSCASLKEPPTSIYPDRQKNPSAYKIDPLP
jgi:hypothetical protein